MKQGSKLQTRIAFTACLSDKLFIIGIVVDIIILVENLMHQQQ